MLGGLLNSGCGCLGSRQQLDCSAVLYCLALAVIVAAFEDSWLAATSRARFGTRSAGVSSPRIPINESTLVQV